MNLSQIITISKSNLLSISETCFSFIAKHLKHSCVLGKRKDLWCCGLLSAVEWEMQFGLSTQFKVEIFFHTGYTFSLTQTLEWSIQIYWGQDDWNWFGTGHWGGSEEKFGVKAAYLANMPNKKWWQEVIAGKLLLDKGLFPSWRKLEIETGGGTGFVLKLANWTRKLKWEKSLKARQKSEQLQWYSKLQAKKLHCSRGNLWFGN